MSKCPIPLYVVVSTKLNHPEITFGTAPSTVAKNCVMKIREGRQRLAKTL